MPDNEPTVKGSWPLVRLIDGVPHWYVAGTNPPQYARDAALERVWREGKGRKKVLVACEYSGIVRDALLKLGHDAMSCDYYPTERPGPHYQGDVRDIINDGWDLMIAHPPCTDLAVSGARHFYRKQQQQAEALAFVRLLLAAPIPRIAIENPVSIISTRIRPADQTIQPWMFGHGETKATCLWLKNLPRLVPTNRVDGREPRVHMLPPSPDRWKERSRTYPGIAEAMAAQWGAALLEPIQTELWEVA